MTVDAYVAELRRLLPSTRRDRMLREVEAHLCDAVTALEQTGLPRSRAEAEAVAAFGPVEDVAHDLAVEVAPVAVRRAAAVALLGAGALLLPLHAIPEQLLPPAPWSERPAHLTALLSVATAAWLLSLGLGAVALGAASTGRSRAAVAALTGAGAAVVLCAGAGGAATIAWGIAVPGTDTWTSAGLSAPVTAAALGTTIAAAAWARGRRPLLR